jgi:hypothetical protein
LQHIGKNKLNMEEIKKYYRVFDHQRGCYFATGYNSESMEELIKDFQSYISMAIEVEEYAVEIQELHLATWSEIADYLQEVTLEESTTLFE